MRGFWLVLRGSKEYTFLQTFLMHKFTSLAAVLLLAHLLVSRQVQASLDDFNLGVGHSGSNELTISADSPGEFDYSLYLRTADNTATAISVHYVGVNNLQRAFHLVAGLMNRVLQTMPTQVPV